MCRSIHPPTSLPRRPVLQMRRRSGRYLPVDTAARGWLAWLLAAVYLASAVSPLDAQEQASAPPGAHPAETAEEAPAFDPRGPRIIVSEGDAPAAEQGAAPSFDPRGSDEAEPAFPAPPPRQPITMQPMEPLPEVQPGDLDTPQKMLALLGVDASHLEAFHDGAPIGLEEEDTLHKLLYAARRFPISRLEGMVHGQLNLDQLTAAPGQRRGEVFPVEGFVTEVIEHQPLPEVADRYQLPRYYECRLLIGDSNLAATVYTNIIPKAWEIGQPIRERVSALGIFVKLAGETNGPSPQPVFVAKRIAWHPDTFLGNLGMDMGLFDDLQHRKTLMSEDRECFYRLLHLAEQFEPTQLHQAAEQTKAYFAELAAQQEKPTKAGLGFIIGEILKHPDAFAGMPFELTGVLKRAIKVRVPDADIRERYGIDHYYELQVFLDLEYILDAGDQKHRFANYPVTVCVRSLPAGIPEGERLREVVRIPAVLMKVWAYQSELTMAHDDNKTQTAPLFIGRTIGWLPVKSTTNPVAGMIAGMLVLLALLGLGYGIWRYNRDDRAFRQLTKALEPEEPDLRGLADLDRRRS